MKKSMVILCAMLLVFGVVGVANATLVGEYLFSGNTSDTSGNNYNVTNLNTNIENSLVLL